MLSKFFKCPIRLQELRGIPAGPSLEGFARQLCQIGYSTFTAKGHIRTAEHFAYWDRWGGPCTRRSERIIHTEL